MSCNGCRVLRKGCNEKCILRESLRGIESPQAQGNAMLFVAKFFGRAGLVSFLSAVPDSQRPAERSACYGPVTGKFARRRWRRCSEAMSYVQSRRFPSNLRLKNSTTPRKTNNIHFLGSLDLRSDRANDFRELTERAESAADLDLCLTAGGRGIRRREETPSMDPEESKPTTFESGLTYRRNLQGGSEAKLLRLF
ncbi:LOB domain-containing protein 37 [Actinidia rufa]|uniref:LOB domain-containing protein 37 n=1 Tax=Actinidia rufa TaxID=165716 RepID=A0A7J0EVM4_9ERIC|nr:LOB domain-containing protein 37 [Actinidia rufa]